MMYASAVRANWYAVLSARDPGTGKRKVRFVSLPR
jgi:hypothetical protein